MKGCVIPKIHYFKNIDVRRKWPPWLWTDVKHVQMMDGQVQALKTCYQHSSEISALTVEPEVNSGSGWSGWEKKPCHFDKTPSQLFLLHLASRAWQATSGRSTVFTTLKESAHRGRAFFWQYAKDQSHCDKAAHFCFKCSACSSFVNSLQCERQTCWHCNYITCLTGAVWLHK